MNEMQLVAFYLENEEYALEVSNIQEIIRTLKVTRVPKAPVSVDGVINLRGNIIPILNLRRRFGLPPGEVTENTRVIIVKVDNMVYGLLVDDVLEVIRFEDAQIEPPPAVSDKVKTEYLSGVVRIEDRLLIMLDLQKVTDVLN